MRTYALFKQSSLANGEKFWCMHPALRNTAVCDDNGNVRSHLSAISCANTAQRHMQKRFIKISCFKHRFENS